MRRRTLLILAQILSATLVGCAAEDDSLSEGLGEQQTADGLFDAPGDPSELMVLEEQQAPRVCPSTGHITYVLRRANAPTDAQRGAYTKIRVAMDKAVSYYNCYTDITRALTVEFDPSVATADGNSAGNIRFGAENTFEYTRAMHEIAHTLGVGTAPLWPSLLDSGTFSGRAATAQLRAITGKADAVLHADRQHFWPYGLNYAREVDTALDPEAELIAHCKMVTAIRRDLGLQR